jgi:hypothetical protein
MTDELWRERDAWEVRVGEIVELMELRAEVERLRNGNKGFTSHCTDCCCNALWEVLGNPPYEPNGGIVERVAKMQAEVERLKAQPTAAQERAAIVAMIESLLDDCGRYRGVEDITPCRVVDSILNCIKLGEHWPMEEEKE